MLIYLDLTVVLPRKSPGIDENIIDYQKFTTGICCMKTPEKG